MGQNIGVCFVPGVRVFFLSKRAHIDPDITTRLVRFISSARTSLDCAIYDFRDLEVLAAVRAALRRGCKIRIAYDAGEMTRKPGADPKPSGTQQALDEFGLLKFAKAIRRTSNAYLHHKFLIRDQQAIWTGSGNFTAGALELQDNNFVAVRSRKLAMRYRQIFELIWNRPSKAAAIIPMALARSRIDDVAGAWIWPFFEPAAKKHVENAIARALERATKVRVAAFEISDKDILSALKRFAKPAANIRGIYDINGMGGALARIKSPDPELYWWYKGDSRFVGVKSHPFNQAGLNDFHHNKTIIIDDRVVITGTYNFSEHAETNGEDILFIRSRKIAAAYTRYFRGMFVHYKSASSH
jgi:phosphatidylserine/phosphatidylglycerophosphate/cardiolipin synthase-like enzyme